MTEPSPRASSVRRTVVVALVLVVGQLALCAVIGWLTFGNPFHPVPTTGADIAAPAAGRVDAAVPRPGSRAPAPTRPVKARRSASAGAGSVRPTAPAPRRSSPATRRTERTSPAAARTPTADTALVSPMPSATIQEPVEPDTACAPVNAEGRTADGERVRCVRAREGVLRWHLTG